MSIPIDLNNIHIADLSKIEIQPSNKSFGRRFTIKVGNGSQEVRIEELNKVAKRLLEEAKNGSAKDQKKVNAFISKLGLEGVDDIEELRDQIIELYQNLDHDVPDDAVFRDPVVIDGTSYIVESEFGYGDPKLFIQEDGKEWREDLLEISKGYATYETVSGPIPDKFLPVLSALKVRGEKRRDEVAAQGEKREQMISLCRGILGASPGDVVFREPIVVGERSFQIHVDTSFRVSLQEVDNIGDTGRLEFEKGRTRYEGKITGLPSEFLPILDEILTQLQARSDEIKAICKLRDDIVDLYQKLSEIGPVDIDGDSYHVVREPGVNLRLKIQAEKNAQITIAKGESRRGMNRRLVPAEMMPALIEMHERLLTRCSEIENEEVDSLIGLKNIFDDPEMFSKGVALLEKASSAGIPGTIDVWEVDGLLHLQEKRYKGTNLGLVQIGAKGDQEAAKRLFSTAVYNASVANSFYHKKSVSILRETLPCIPTWHLNKWLGSLGQSSEFEVVYKGESGIDAGGLKREYIGTIASAIVNQKTLFKEVDGSLTLPCNPNEVETYQNIGMLFAECYKSKSTVDAWESYERELITTGRLYSDALFKAALLLSYDDLSEAIATRDTEIKIARSILSDLDSNGSDTVKNMIQCFELLDGDSQDFSLAFYMLEESVQEVYEDQDLNPDLQKIKANEVQFKEDLFNALMKDGTTIDELKGISLGNMVGPIFQIAKGMSSRILEWDIERTKPIDVFSIKIQGSIDRNQIVASIQTVSDPVLTQKIVWLKEWIQKDASDTEIKAFLKFVSGATSLAGATPIKVDAQAAPSPFLSASSCNMHIHMSDKMSYRGNPDSWDNTKEGFIRNLKTSITVDEFQIS